jgi:hypothetical protein
MRRTPNALGNALAPPSELEDWKALLKGLSWVLRLRGLDLFSIRYCSQACCNASSIAAADCSCVLWIVPSRYSGGE